MAGLLPSCSARASCSSIAACIWRRSLYALASSVGRPRRSSSLRAARLKWAQCEAVERDNAARPRPLYSQRTAACQARPGGERLHRARAWLPAAPPHRPSARVGEQARAQLTETDGPGLLAFPRTGRLPRAFPWQPPHRGRAHARCEYSAASNSAEKRSGRRKVTASPEQGQGNRAGKKGRLCARATHLGRIGAGAQVLEKHVVGEGLGKKRDNLCRVGRRKTPSFRRLGERQPGRARLDPFAAAAMTFLSALPSLVHTLTMAGPAESAMAVSSSASFCSRPRNCSRLVGRPMSRSMTTWRGETCCDASASC